MNYSSLAYALMLGRRMGKTYQTAQACKNIGATMICHNNQEAKRVTQEYGIKTVSMDKELRGHSGPFLIDPHAVESLCYKASSDLKTLRDELEERTDQLISYQQTLRYRDAQYEELIRKLDLLCQSAKTENRKL